MILSLCMLVVNSPDPIQANQVTPGFRSHLIHLIKSHTGVLRKLWNFRLLRPQHHVLQTRLAGQTGQADQD